MAEIKNPNQQGGGGQDSKTILIFTGLFLVILLGMQYFRAKKGPETAPAQQQTSATTNSASQQQAAQTPNAPVAANASSPAPQSAASTG